jgi:hypothetical protein
MDKRRHVVPAMGPHVQGWLRFLMKPMPTVWNRKVLACSKPFQLQKTSSSTVLMFQTHLRKPLHHNKASLYNLIVPSMSGGLSISSTPLFPKTTSFQSFLLCRATQNLRKKHADALLCEIGLIPTVHKPCLYSGIINGKRVIVKHQVDDFATTTPDQCKADILLDMLDGYLSIPIKRQGYLDMFNGLNVTQTCDYIQIDCHSFVEKVCKKYLTTWMHTIPIMDK